MTTHDPHLLLESNIHSLLESEKYDHLDGYQKTSMEIMLRNTHKGWQESLNENSTGDIAQFTPILMPIVRRTMPNLIGGDLLDIQPMAAPTGFMYALINQYVGNSINKLSPNSNGKIVKLSAPTTVAAGDTVFTDSTVVYVESNKVLLNFGGTAINIGDEIEAGVAVEGVYSNEAAFKNVLKNYAGSHSSAVAENMGDEINQIGLSIVQKAISAKTDILSTRYTIEMYQDMKSQHNLSADEELIRLISYELQAEIDRKIVDFVNSTSHQMTDMTFTPTIGTDGRWEIERYRSQAIRIDKEASQIGIDTKLGRGNTLVVSPKVLTMLRQIGKFSQAPVKSNLLKPVSGGYAGIYDDTFKVIVDQYAESDYCTVLYKGMRTGESMGVYSPYMPLSFTKVTNNASGQPGIIARTRYAMAAIPGLEKAESLDRARNYGRSFGVNFENTQLA